MALGGDDVIIAYTQYLCKHAITTYNRMAWQWAETLVEIRGTLVDIKERPNRGANTIFPNMNLKGLSV